MRNLLGILLMVGAGIVAPTAILWLLGAPVWAWPAVVAAVCAIGLVVVLLGWVEAKFDVPWYSVSLVVYVITMIQIAGWLVAGLPWYFLIQWVGITLLAVACVLALLWVFFAGWERVFGFEDDESLDKD